LSLNWNEGVTETSTENRAVLLILFLFPFFTYWPVVAFPYLLIDDNWLLRGWSEPDYPSMRFIAILQGRPSLMLMAWASSALLRAFGETGIQLMRLAGVAMLGICAILAFAYTRYLALTKPFRILAALLWTTAPATQVVVADGTWLIAGIAASLAAVLCLMRPFTKVSICGTIALLLIAATTYQPCFFIAPALYFLTLFDITRNQWRAATLRLGVLVAAFSIYYFTWRFFFAIMYVGSEEQRYNPTALLNSSQLIKRLPVHFRDRTWLLTQFWDIPNSSPKFKSVVSGALVIALLAAIVAWTKFDRPKFQCLFWMPVLIAIAFFAAEIPSLPTLAQQSSYVTAIGSSIVIATAAAILFSFVFAHYSALRPYAVSATILIVCFGGMLASASVTRHFAIPTSIDMKAIAYYALGRDGKRKSDGTIVLCIFRQEHTSYGYGEFAWSNMGHPFYAYWHSRNVLDLLGKESSKLVLIMRDSMGLKSDQVFPDGANIGNGCRPDEFLDLSKRDKGSLFRPTRDIR
jgi:hypothetical protein